MSDLIQIASAALLEPAGLQQSDVEGLVGRMAGGAIDYADLYFQFTRHESWALEDGAVKSGSRNIDHGVGARAISGEKTGFSYSDEFELPILTEATDAARAIARSGGAVEGKAFVVRQGRSPARYIAVDPLSSTLDTDKVALLQQVEAEARRQDSRVSQVMASLSGVQDVILIVRHDGMLAADIRPLVRLNVNVIVEHQGRREQGSAGGGGRFGYSWFQDDERALGYAE